MALEAVPIISTNQKPGIFSLLYHKGLVGTALSLTPPRKSLLREFRGLHRRSPRTDRCCSERGRWDHTRRLPKTIRTRVQEAPHVLLRRQSTVKVEQSTIQ